MNERDKMKSEKTKTVANDNKNNTEDDKKRYCCCCNDKTLRSLAIVFLLSGSIANLTNPGTFGRAEIVRDISCAVYLLPIITFMYVPVIIPQLILPKGVTEPYFRVLGKVLGLTIEEDLTLDNIEQWMPEKIVKGEHLPKHFRGIFWLDGNGGCGGVGGSDIASLAAGDWNADAKVLYFPLYRAWTFSHHPSYYSDILRAYLFRWTYLFHFDEELKHAEITLQLFGVDVPTRSFGSFQFDAMGPPNDIGNLYRRPSWIGIKPEEGVEPNDVYWLRRLVDANGKRDDKVFAMFENAYNDGTGKPTLNTKDAGHGASEWREFEGKRKPRGGRILKAVEIAKCTSRNQVFRTA